MITDQWTTASAYILDGGLDVQTMGGFSGLAPTPTLAQLQRPIRTGRLRFALLTDRRPLTECNHVVQQDRSLVARPLQSGSAIRLRRPEPQPARPDALFLRPGQRADAEQQSGELS